MNRVACLLAALSVLSTATGCGGGSDEANSPPPDTTPSSPFGVHDAATLPMTTSNFKQVSAQAYVAYRALHAMTNYPDFFASAVTPAQPNTTLNCGIGSMDVTFFDNDHDGAVSVGDSVVLLDHQCNHAQVSGTLTILAFDPALRQKNAYRTGATSYRFDGSFVYDTMAAYGVQPSLSGSFMMSPYQDTGLLTRAIGNVAYQSKVEESLLLSNVSISTLQPSAGQYGIGGDCSMDITLDTSLVPGLRLKFDTDSTLWDFLTAEDSPHPGKIVLSGSNGTKVSISSPGTDISSFDLDADTTGSGVIDTSTTLNTAQFYLAY